MLSFQRQVFRRRRVNNKLRLRLCRHDAGKATVCRNSGILVIPERQQDSIFLPQTLANGKFTSNLDFVGIKSISGIGLNATVDA